MTGQPHSYTLLGVLGTGAFGKVYLARAWLADGSSNEVAVKLLHAELEPEASVVQRFQAEARVLAMLRDPALVAHAAPERLFGHWAVVMDIVRGESVDRVIRRRGPLPPRVALELVAELARLMHRAWEQEVAPGEPLRLVHRDIKPANIHLTHDGTVKLLDFGIARTDHTSFDAATQAEVPGTNGYIAPERFRGEEGPAGDVFSLGVTLHVLLTGERPRPFATGEGSVSPHAPPLCAQDEAALAFAADLVAIGAQARPTAAEVERRANRLARSFDGPSLAEWSRSNVVRRLSIEADELVGQTWWTREAQAASRCRILWALAAGFTLTLALGLCAWINTT